VKLGVGGEIAEGRDGFHELSFRHIELRAHSAIEASEFSSTLPGPVEFGAMVVSVEHLRRGPDRGP